MRANRSLLPVPAAWALLAALAFTPSASAQIAAPGAADPAGAELHKRLDEAGQALRIGERSLDLGRLKAFYEKRAYKPAWIAKGALVPRAARFVDVLRGAEADGLDPAQYHLAALQAPRGPATPQSLAEQELLLTDAFLRYTTHLRNGQVRPDHVDWDWRILPGEFDSAAFLDETVALDAVAPALGQLAPPYAAYAKLKDTLARYRDIARAGGWPALAEGPAIKAGKKDDRVPLVRRQLVTIGDLSAAEAEAKDPAVLDAKLQAGLKRFQARHGLDEDGAVGKDTLAALNVPAETRVNQILANMERWRWQPRQMEPQHVDVNIPAFHLEVVDNGAVTMAMRVIVGDVKHPTPSFRGVITGVVVNPHWTVPTTIAGREILPKLKKDPAYLAKNGLRILGADNSDLASGQGIDWNRLGKMPYRLRQVPGSDNALGRFKFHIPLPGDIYLHDTPQRQHFAKAFRALSHGCVRVQQPKELATLVLRDQPAWTAEKLTQQVTKGETLSVPLTQALPVYLMYWTAWVGVDGAVNFRDDIYGRDRHLKLAIDRQRKDAPVLVGLAQPATRP